MDYISRPHTNVSGAGVAMVRVSCTLCAALARASGVNTITGSEVVVISCSAPNVGSPTGTVMIEVPLAKVTVMVVFDRVGREQ
jgi:hypothetical protein